MSQPLICVDLSSIKKMESDPGTGLALLGTLLESNPALRRYLRMESETGGISPSFLTANLLVRDADIRRGIEGPQLVVTWQPPKVVVGVDKIIVVRKKYDFPLTPTDGGGQKIVFDSSAPVGDPLNPEGLGVADAGWVNNVEPDLEPCRCYYYTIFTILAGGEGLFSPVTQVAEFAIQTGYFTQKLFELLPDLYITGDKHLEDVTSGKIALKRGFDSMEKEFRNLFEDGLVQKGQLQRFLKIFGTELDIVKGLIDCLPTIYDVDEACCRFLQAMAALIGLSLNTELPCDRQRKEVKNAVAIYKIKGTKAAIEARARVISGFQVQVQEWCGNILLSNTLDRTSMGSPNPGLSQLFGMPGDTTDYVIGRDISFTRFTVFFLLKCDDCLSDLIVKKLMRVLPPEFPVCRIGSFMFIDCTFEEEYDRSRLKELFCDILEDKTVVEDFRPNCWLISNRLPDPRLPPAPPFQPPLPVEFSFERHESNSLEAVTASDQRLCFEGFEDELTVQTIDVEDLSDCVLISNVIPRLTSDLRWKTKGEDLVCFPLEFSEDEVQRGEFVEEVTCASLGLQLLSSDLTKLTNSLESVVSPCGGPAEYWWDEMEFAGPCPPRVGFARVGCSRVAGPECGERVGDRVDCARVA